MIKHKPAARINVKLSKGRVKVSASNLDADADTVNALIMALLELSKEQPGVFMAVSIAGAELVKNDEELQEHIQHLLSGARHCEETNQ